MPAKSEAQRRLFGAILSYKRGQMKNPSKKIRKIAKGISESDASDFAKKRMGLAKSMTMHKY